MKSRFFILAVMTASIWSASAQVSAHAPALKIERPAAAGTRFSDAALIQKPAVRVNGTVLSELDLKREMITIFPYAQQHNGQVPKEMEPEVRKGALAMIIFEELLYQEAKRRNVAIAPERMAKAEKQFRTQVEDRKVYEAYLKAECNNSPKVLQEKIRRALLIDQMMKTEVVQKSHVTLEAAKAYYDHNPKRFEHGETISIQTISIIPPEAASKEIQQEAADKSKEALRLARVTKTYQEFGLLAERISDDDWRTHLGDRKTVDVTAVPPEVAKVARAMKVGQVSDIIKVDRAYVIIRLNAHTAAGRTPFAEIKTQLQSDLQKEKTQQIRSALNEQLRKNAKIEVL